MSNTITDGTTTITPDLVEGVLEAKRESRIIQHPILGAQAYAMTLAPARLRSGTLKILVSVEADSVTAVNLLASGVKLTFASTARTSLNMPFYVTGDVTRELNPVLGVWWVSADYQETDS